MYSLGFGAQALWGWEFGSPGCGIKIRRFGSGLGFAVYFQRMFMGLSNH